MFGYLECKRYVVHAWTDDRSWVAKLRLGHTILRGKGTFGKQDGVSVGLAYFLKYDISQSDARGHNRNKFFLLYLTHRPYLK